MKTRLLTLLFCFLVGFFLISCSTPKKLIASKEEKTKVEQAIQESNTGTTSSFVDTTKTNGVEVTYTKIEYYQPKANEEYTREPKCQNDELSTANKQPPNKGHIKSIEQLIVKKNSEEKGVKQNQEENTSYKEEATTTEIGKTEANTEQPASDPYKWRYILGILIAIIVIGTGGYFLLRKSKVVTFIKKIFSS